MTRRFFTGVAVTSTGRILGANDRIRAGFIGVGARGDRLLDLFREAGAQIAAVCDVYEPHLDFASKKVEGGLRTKDYRRVLDEPSVDVVVIATPDHWHALQFVHACQAGKDIYVEKPLSLTVFEGRLMVEAARRYSRVVQVGTQRRSSPMVREAVNLIRSGAIGKVTAVRCFDLLNEWPLGIGLQQDTMPPPQLDWDRWLGPAPKVPYNPNRGWYNYRWFWDYSGGQLANMGVHLIDVVRWALGLGYPKRVTAMGGIYAIEDGREIPDTLEVLWDFGVGTLVSFTQYNANDAPGNPQGAELEFRGSRATLYLHSDRFEVVPQSIADRPRYRPSPLRRSETRVAWMAARKPATAPARLTGSALADFEHVRNFLECVRSRREPNAPVLEGHLSTATCLIGNIALRTGATLEWDGANERFTNHEHANRLLHYRYRSPYALKLDSY